MNEKELSANAAGNLLLGKEIPVQRLGFGAMRLTGEGIWGPPRDRNTALAVLRRAVELDINFIDTADSYGPDVSEELIAEALFPYPAGLVIATKGGWNRPGPNQWTHDATPAHLRKAVEGSLKRLRLDRIDVYQLHIPDPAVSFEASVETLAQLRNEGKFAWLRCPTSPRSTSSEHAKLSPSSPCRTAIVLRTANGTMWWIIASAMELLLFPGSRWEQVRLPAMCLSGSRKHTASAARK